MAPSDSDQQAQLRHQSQHVLNAMALDLENIVRDILQQMIFHRKKLDG
jgi:antitoxin component of RelBE/YafQ-DinJ toxin-antitoxin module